MDTSEVIVEILTDIFGEEKKHNELTKQISFDCPVCSYDIKGLDHGDGKGNLEVNYDKSVFKCWSCAETHGTHGHIGKLIDKFGTREDKKLYNVVREDNPSENYKKKEKKLRLPKDFKRFEEVSDFFPEKKRALKYLYSRDINNDVITKYNIGFCYQGEYAGRIIIPSYNTEGDLNYFVARSWNPNNKVKYKNPNYSKDKLIFNESLIDWNKNVYIVEGVFDSFFIDNSIPLLGKFINDFLFESLYEKCSKNIIICLDSDAWHDSLKIYHKLNGGSLFGRVKVIKLEDERDIAELKGNISLDQYYEIK